MAGLPSQPTPTPVAPGQRGLGVLWSSWTVVVLAIALLVAAPVLVILVGMFTNSAATWNHLASTVLVTYVTNSLLLMVGVGLGVLLVGVSTAWLVTLCQFPGRRLFEWALLLPLAAPAYLLAYVYTEWLAFYGPVQTTLRTWFGWETVQDYWFPNVRSLWGAALMLILTLYPYVYLLARTAFLTQAIGTLEASRNLGCGPWRSFFTIALPLARPAVMAGLSLALMETLNDFGTVQYFGVDTFTTGIYRTWFGLGERSTAVQLSAVLLLAVLGLILLERYSRGRAQFYQTANTIHPLSRFQLRGLRAIAAVLVCLLPVVLGLLIPGGILLKLALEPMSSGDPALGESSDDQGGDYSGGGFSTALPGEGTPIVGTSEFWTYASHSLLLALLTAAIAVVLSILLAYGLRLYPKRLVRLATQISVMGYAVPGSVIAVGILVPLGAFDNAIDQWAQATLGVGTGLLLSGTIAALVYAYLVRFLAVSFSSVEASLSSIKPSLDDAARSLGHTPVSTLLRVHTPLMWGGVLTATMLVFVDVMKELPATLIVRPFNFDTLAIRVYNLASDERLQEAAAPALAIIGVGLIPVLLLSWQVARSRRSG